jgi:hypothetical protein
MYVCLSVALFLKSRRNARLRVILAQNVKILLSMIILFLFIMLFVLPFIF